jgi:transcriptional repressor NrdR
MVIKRDGKREPFEREKLRAGLAKACAKQRVTDEDIDLIVDEMILMRLRRLDMVAYLRFASVYRQYTDVDQFRSELVRLAGTGVGNGR